MIFRSWFGFILPLTILALLCPAAGLYAQSDDSAEGTTDEITEDAPDAPEEQPEEAPIVFEEQAVSSHPAPVGIHNGISEGRNGGIGDRGQGSGFGRGSEVPSPGFPKGQGLHFEGPPDGRTSTQQGMSINWHTLPVPDDPAGRALYKNIKPTTMNSISHTNVMPGGSSYLYYQHTRSYKCSPWTGKTAPGSCMPDWFDKGISDGNPLRVRILVPPGVRSVALRFQALNSGSGFIFGGVSLEPDQGLPNKAQRSLIHDTINMSGTDFGGSLGYWGMDQYMNIQLQLRPVGGRFVDIARSKGPDSAQPYYVYLTLWSPERHPWGISQASIDMFIGNAALYTQWVRECLDKGNDCVQ